MNPRRIQLAVMAIGLVFAGRYVSTWRPDPIVATIQTPDGHRIVATVDREGRSKVRRLLTAGANPILLASSPSRVIDLKLDSSRNRLFVLSETQLICVNYLDLDNDWSLYHRLNADRVQLLFSPSKETVVLIGPRAFTYTGNEGIEIKALDANNGGSRHSLYRNNVEEVTVRDDAMTIEFANKQGLTLSFEAEAAADSLAAASWTPTTCTEYARDGTLMREWKTDRTETIQRIKHERPFYESSGAVIGLALVMVVPMVFWTRELVVDGLAASRVYRPFINLTLLLGLLFLMGMPIGSRVLDVDPNPLQLEIPMYVLLAAAQAMLFALLVRIAEPRHLWIAILAACTFPPMLLIVFLARVVRGPRNRPKQPSKFRFGIAEMLLSTTGIALLIAVGLQSLWMVGAGLGIALHVLVSYLVTRTRELSWGTLVISLVLVTLALTLQSVVNFWVMFYLFIVPLAFSLIGIQGWLDELPSSDQVATADGLVDIVDVWSPSKGEA